ncbi:hypothetical protein [Thermomonospora cellulosilytica]|uniref:Uncharacterized protein n=1 Tax=Thermomonospora cellulosilytica TaxID=1411118 RepID=A0A7W3R6D0_9ACTN|nr:hypothetical protein [Thermomonospora cellulosilytica]MBA9002008.1 hypothetical protein [Thermomonospora cellulosilytica]
MALLDKDTLLAALDRAEVETKDVAVPELGGTVRVREMPGTLRNRMEATYATIRNGGDSKSLDTVTALMIATCVVDESGRQLMNVNEAKRLLSVRPKVAFRLRDAIIDVSAVDEEDVEALAEVFGDAQSDSSISG